MKTVDTLPNARAKKEKVEKDTDTSVKEKERPEQESDDLPTNCHPIEELKGQWMAWAHKTTFHGVSTIFDGRTSIVRRVIWFVILGFMWYDLVTNCWSEWSRYRQYNTLTQETIRYDSVLKFPAVTICNLNRIRQEAVSDPRERAILRNLFINKPNATALLEFPGEEFVKNFSLRKAIIEGSMPIDDSIILCVVPSEGALKSCSPVEQFSGDDYCHTINPPTENNSKILSAWYEDMIYGAYILMSVAQNKYYISYGMAAGFKVMIHDENDLPDPNKAVFVGPGHLYTLTLQKHEFTFLPSPVKAFGEKECVPREVLTTDYSIQKCLTDCREHYVYNICSCAGPARAGVKRECTPLEIIDCYNDAVFNFHINNMIEECACPVPCTMVDYQTQLSSAVFPSNNFYDVLFEGGKIPESHRLARDNLIQLRIFYESKVIIQHTQVLEFGLEDLKSSAGGFLGLLIGASLLSMIELLEMLVMSIFRCFKTRRP